jgi:beta-lactamase class A
VFLSAVPVADLQATLASSASLAPLGVTEQRIESSGRGLEALLSSSAGLLQLSLSVDALTGLITGLLITVAPDLQTGRPRSWPEVESSVAALAPESQYLVASPAGAACETLRGARADEVLAIGSTFKLYVLAEAAHQIDAGELSWDTEVSVEDALESLPSGELQNAPAGTRVSIRYLADAMISISDNTATDHLLERLGRERVEAALVEAGHASPERNVPFLSTRELFLFKLELSAAEQDAYVAGDVAARRAFLETLRGRVPSLDGAADWVAPRRIADLEWFASAGDLCRVMAHLLQLSERPALAPLSEILSLNPGLPIDPVAFPYIGFKGGSEPGVLNLSWLVRDASDRFRFVSFGYNDPSAPIDETPALVIALGAFDLLAAGE